MVPGVRIEVMDIRIAGVTTTDGGIGIATPEGFYDNTSGVRGQRKRNSIMARVPIRVLQSEIIQVQSIGLHLCCRRWCHSGEAVLGRADRGGTAATTSTRP